MTQLVIEGIFIDLYENDPPRITLNIEDIQDTKTVSAYTQTFRVPATTSNYEFFKSAFEINGLDFDVTVKKSAQILFNGAEFVSGEVRLQKIYENKISNKIDYELIFLGETKDFSSNVGNSFLCDLDSSELNHEFTIENVQASWQAYPQGSTTDGLLNGDVLYPLVNFGNTYNDSGNPEQTRIELGTGINYFTNSAYPLEVDRFKPMVRAKWIWDKIFETSGFTYDSEFLNSDTFKQIYVSAWGNDANAAVPSLSTQNLAKIQSSGLFYNNTLQREFSLFGDILLDVNVGDQLPFVFDEIAFDYSNNALDVTPIFYPQETFSIYHYEVPQNGTYSFRLRGGFVVEILLYTVFDFLDFEVALKKYDPVTQTTTNISASAAGTVFQGVPLLTFNLDLVVNDVILNQGDLVYFGLEVTDVLAAPGNSAVTLLFLQSAIGSSLEVTEAPGDSNVSASFDCQYKQIDFIRDILTKFRLVMVPDRIQSKHFTVEPWSNYIASGDVIDWTPKLDVSKDITIEPLFFSQKQRIKFSDKEDKDWLNALNEDQFKEIFGTLELDSQNDILSDEREIETKFAPTPVTQINNATPTNNENFIIPHIYVKETKDYSGVSKVINNPIKPVTRLLFYNGLKSIDGFWYSENISGPIAFPSYPMVSPYQEYPVTFNTLDLNWQAENGYVQYLDPLVNGSSVYDTYWSNYISSLYSPNARRVTAHFVLAAEDLFPFNFDDVIFVKDTYYYVEKIENVQLDKKQSVRVSLIKLLDYNPPSSGYIPPIDYLEWQEIDQDWEDITDEWGTF